MTNWWTSLLKSITNTIVTYFKLERTCENAHLHQVNFYGLCDPAQVPYRNI